MKSTNKPYPFVVWKAILVGIPACFLCLAVWLPCRAVSWMADIASNIESFANECAQRVANWCRINKQS